LSPASKPPLIIAWESDLFLYYSHLDSPDGKNIYAVFFTFYPVSNAVYTGERNNFSPIPPNEG